MDSGRMELARSVPAVILSGIGMIWSLTLLIGKRNHISRNLLVCISAAGLCFYHIFFINIAAIDLRGSWDDIDGLLYYRLNLAANFFLYVNPSLLWCAAMDVFRTSIPQSDKKNNTSYHITLTATYFAYLFTMTMLVVAILTTDYKASFNDNTNIPAINSMATISFLMFGQWAFPILFLIQYYATSSKKFVRTFSRSLWWFFGILLLITILNTIVSVFSFVWIDWIGNSIAVSFAILYVCSVGPKWIVSRSHHDRLSWSEILEEPENGLVGRGSVSRIRPVYGGRYEESEDLYTHKVEISK